MTTISAVVPTYNRAGTLGRALASIARQTRSPDEIVIVDDGSTDHTKDLLGGFPDIRVVRLASAHGAGYARNVGARTARGEWIAFLDSDDAWEPRKLELQEKATRSPTRPDLVVTGVVVHGVHGDVEQFGFAGVSPDEGWSFEAFQTYPFSPTTWLIRRSVLEALGAFDDSLQNCEDLDLLARMSGRVRMLGLVEPLVVKYNQRDSLDDDLERTASSYQALFTRYPALWKRAPRAATASHLRLATMYMRAGQARLARGALWRALRNAPAEPAPWVLLAASLLGGGTYRHALRRLRP